MIHNTYQQVLNVLICINVATSVNIPSQLIKQIYTSAW